MFTKSLGSKLVWQSNISHGCYIQNHKVGVSPFFIAVKTNEVYTVADFVLQSEIAEQIREALQILSSWNPTWHFMVDYSEAEIEVIQSTFPACKVYLCDFHQEQAWERWVKDKKLGLSSDDGVLDLLRDVAQSLSPTDHDQPLDHYYRQHVQNLMDNEIWKNNIAVQEWLMESG